MALPTCDCVKTQTPNEVQQSIYCALLSLIAASGGDVGSDEYTSAPALVASSGSIPAGVLGWSITAISGTVTVNGTALAVGNSVRGGGYGGRTLKTAIAYTITSGTALVSYDTPS
tara:strand:+ start:61 stop:405 length:345 start_codon:yes stop_codon:yes gene_type:complete